MGHQQFYLDKTIWSSVISSPLIHQQSLFSSSHGNVTTEAPFYIWVEDHIHPVAQAFLATLFNWFTTTLGASIVLFCGRMSDSVRDRVLNCMYGAAAGVMLAAAHFGLLNPSLNLAVEAMGGNKRLAIIPFVIPCFLGCISLLLFDALLHKFPFTWKKNESESSRKIKKQLEEIESSMTQVAITKSPSSHSDETDVLSDLEEEAVEQENQSHAQNNNITQSEEAIEMETDQKSKQKSNLTRTILLILAVTIHNLPEGIVVGVAFAAASSHAIPLSSAISLALGVAIQNIPEGMAVALPLQKDGLSTWKCFLFGSVSGLMEPVGGLIGVLLVYFSRSILPYALSFAGGAMIFVIVCELIPEMSKKEHPHDDLKQDSNEESHGIIHLIDERLGLIGFVFGFVVMMILECAL